MKEGAVREYTERAKKVMEKADQVLALSVGASQLISVIYEKINFKETINHLPDWYGVRSRLDHLHEAGSWRVYSTPVSFRLSETGSFGYRCPQRYHILFVLRQLHVVKWDGWNTCHYVWLQ